MDPFQYHPSGWLDTSAESAGPGAPRHARRTKKTASPAYLGAGEAAEQWRRKKLFEEGARDYSAQITPRKTKASVVIRNGVVRGYTTGLNLTVHSVARTNDDLKGLIATAGKKHINFLLPVRNIELLEWCLENGFRLAMPVSLLTVGMYQVPKGAYLHSGF